MVLIIFIIFSCYACSIGIGYFISIFNTVFIHLIKFTGNNFDREFLIYHNPEIIHKSPPSMGYSASYPTGMSYTIPQPSRPTGELNLMLNSSDINQNYAIQSLLQISRQHLDYISHKLQGDYYYKPYRIEYSDMHSHDSLESQNRFFDTTIEYNVDALDPDITISRAMARVMGGLEIIKCSSCNCISFDAQTNYNMPYNDYTTWYSIKLNFENMEWKKD